MPGEAYRFRLVGRNAAPARRATTFGAEEPRGEEPGDEERGVRDEREGDHPPQGRASAVHEQDEEGAERRDRELEEGGRPRERVRVAAAHLRERGDGHADGPVGGGRGVRDEAHEDGLERVEADADEHRRRNRDGRAEAGHALHEVPEAPDDEEREDARIARNAGEARADCPHRARFDRERIDEERGEDDEADRVEREADAVGHHRRDLRGRQVVPEEGERKREREKGRTERGPMGLDLEERERGRQEGDRQEGEREKGNVHVFSGRGVSPGGGR